VKAKLERGGEGGGGGVALVSERSGE